MINKIFVLVVAIGVCIWLGMYIKSYNANTTFNAQQRFKNIMELADEQAKVMMKEFDEKKKKAYQIMKDRKDSLLQQQQKELFDQQ